MGVVSITKKDKIDNRKGYDCEGEADCTTCDDVVKIYHTANFSLIPIDTVKDNIAKGRDNSKSTHARRKRESYTAKAHAVAIPFRKSATDVKIIFLAFRFITV
jgi:hypothetical protein